MGAPDPAWELEMEKRFELEGKVQQAADDSLEHRIELLEEWQAAQLAVSAVRRWAFPIGLSILGAVVTLFNVYASVTRKH